MKYFGMYLLILILLFGCSPRLHTLISLSNEQKAQRNYLALQEKKYQQLVNDIKKDRLKIGLDKDRIIKLYGEPIAEKTINGQTVFSYRSPTDFFPKEKVYLYFNLQGILTDFELISEKQKENPATN